MQKSFPAEHVNLVASMLTDDPDVLINDRQVLTEFWGNQPAQSPVQRILGQALSRDQIQGGPGYQRAIQDLEREFEAFVRYQPSLAKAGMEAAAQAFVNYKRTGQMPAERNPAELDHMGGQDWRSDRV